MPSWRTPSRNRVPVSPRTIRMIETLARICPAISHLSCGRLQAMGTMRVPAVDYIKDLRDAADVHRTAAAGVERT
jgi:hypothetical protein